MTTIFCFKRWLYGFSTVFFVNYVVPNIYVYIFIPLFGMGYTINNYPMDSKILNFMEILNEGIILCSAYFILSFTQWICDPMLRYKIGWLYIVINSIVIFLNFSIIFYEIYRGIKKERRRQKWLKEWNIFFKMYMIDN